MTAANQQQTNDSERIDLGELFNTILQSWKLIGVCVFLSVFVAIFYLRVTSSIYSVDGLVQIENNQSTSDAVLGDTGLSGLADMKSPAETEIQLLKSRFVLGSVIQNLNLDVVLSSDRNHWYHRIFHPTPEKVTYTKDGVTYATKGLSFEVRKFNVPYALLDKTFELSFLSGGRYQLDLVDQSKISGFEGQAPIQGVVGRLLTVPLGDGVLQLLIHADSRNLESHTLHLRKQNLLQTVSNIRGNLTILERGKQTGVLSLIYQGEDPDNIKQILNEIMRVYLAQNVEGRTQETQQTLQFLDNQLPKLKAELELSENTYNNFREKNNTIDPTKEAELLLQQSVELKTKKIELEQQRAVLGQKYTASFPLIEQLQAQISAIDRDSKDLDSRVLAMPELQRKYLQLYRDVQVNTVLYTSLLNSYQQLKILKAGRTATVRILDQAIKSAQPVKPQKALVLLLSLVLGLVLSGIALFLRSLIFSGVKDSDRIEAETGFSVIATVPRSVSQRKTLGSRAKKLSLIARDDPEDLAVESLRSLRTMVHFSATQKTNNIILITGPSPAIGKSFIAANLSVVFAQMDKTVVLVDADMRRGHLNKYFNVDKSVGLSDYLKGTQTELGQVCKETTVDGLSFMSRGNAPSNPSELLLGERFQTLLSELSQKFDYVIVDSPPVLAATDAAIIGRQAGMTLIVARYAQTHLRELDLSLSRLSQAGVVPEGIIFNDVQSTAGYGYQYAYKYRVLK